MEYRCRTGQTQKSKIKQLKDENREKILDAIFEMCVCQLVIRFASGNVEDTNYRISTYFIDNILLCTDMSGYEQVNKNSVEAVISLATVTLI